MTTEVEAVVGRELREAERAIDVLGLDAALNEAKDELERAIEAEKCRAIRRLRRGARKAKLELTRAMLAPLERLHRLGRREAAAELDRLGYENVKRSFATPAFEELDPHADQLQELLDGIAVRVTREWVEADLTTVTEDALFQALARLPGARDAASQVVSAALTSGLAFTFEQNEDAVGGWSWTAVLDGATCNPCAAGDGTHYNTWAEAMIDLPNGGPAIVCLGSGRCRCRVVPDPA